MSEYLYTELNNIIYQETFNLTKMQNASLVIFK